MQHESFSANVVTIDCLLKAYRSIETIDKGSKIHDDRVREGLVGVILGLPLIWWLCMPSEMHLEIPTLFYSYINDISMISYRGEGREASL